MCIVFVVLLYLDTEDDLIVILILLLFLKINCDNKSDV
jgi:hypothetical protein